MTIALFGTNYRSENEDVLRRIVLFLQKSGVNVLIERNFYTQICEKSVDFPACETTERQHITADIVMSIGGDGTFLNTASAVGDRGIPMIGINTGRLGFLADIASDEIESVLNDILRGNYKIRERSILQVQTSNQVGQGLPFALNEIAILKQDLSSMISIHVTIDGEFLNTYQADGLLVATPTGSTAYSMSVGGPLLLPQVHDLILAPVASHSLTVRPLVIPDTCAIDLEVESRSKSFLLSLDGRSQVMPQTTKLHIEKANFTTKIIEPQGHSFINTLRNKLMWGIDKRN